MITEKKMLDVWAEHIDDRRVIEEFWDWAEQRYASLDYIHIGKALDEFHGIDQKQLEKERRELLATTRQ